MKEYDNNMTKDEQLREEREALFFKMMFAAFEKADAPKYEALKEQLKDDPSLETTEEEDKAMLDFIAREIKKRDDALAQRNQVSVNALQKKSVRHIKGFAKIAAVVAIILIFMTAVAYATIPNFRVMALNLLLEASGEATRIEITDNAIRSDRQERHDGTNETNIVLLGYSFPDIPDGFTKEEEVQSDQKAWVFYTNAEGKSIKYQVLCGVERDVVHDTEDIYAKDILVHEHAGLLRKKDDAVSVSWYDADNKIYFIINAKGFDTQFVYGLANEVTKAK